MLIISKNDSFPFAFFIIRGGAPLERIRRDHTQALATLFIFCLLIVAVATRASGQDIQALNSEGITLLKEGKYKEALGKFEEGLKICRRENNKPGIAVFLGNMGLAYKNMGEYEKALKIYEESLAINREIKSAVDEMIDLENIGTAHMGLKNLEEALSYYGKALAIAEKQGDRMHQGLCIGNMGISYLELRSYEKAITCLEKGLAIARETKDLAGETVFSSKLGRAYNELGEHKKSLQYYDSALKTVRGTGNRIEEADLLALIAKTLYDEGEAAKALEYSQNALSLYKDAGYRGHDGFIYSLLGSIYTYQAKYGDALECLKRASAAYTEAQDLEGSMKALEYLGQLKRLQGKYDDAIGCFSTILDTAKEVGYKYEEAGALANLGLVYVDTGDPEKARAHMEKALALYRELKSREGEANVLLLLGDACLDGEKYNNALEYYEKSLSASKEIGDSELEKNSLFRMGSLFLQFENYASASDYFRKSLEISRKNDDRIGMISCLVNMAVASMESGETEDSIPRLKEAYELAKGINDLSLQASIKANLGAFCQNLGLYELSLKSYEEAMSISREINDTAMEMKILINGGVIDSAIKKSGDAQKLFDQALEIAQLRGDRISLMKIYAHKGLDYWSENEDEKALENLYSAAKLLEELRGGVSIDELKSSLQIKNQVIYDLIIDILMKKKEVEKALEYAERGKARIFLDSISSHRIVPKTPAEKELAAQELSLVQKIRTLDSLMQKAGIQEIKVMKIQMEKLYQEHEDLLTKIKIVNPEYSSLLRVEPAKLQDIEGALQPGEAIVEFFVSPKNTSVWCITGNQVRAAEIPIPEKELNRMVQGVRRKISDHRDDEKDALKKSLGEIYQKLLEPVAAEFKDKKRLVIVPHGILHYLPFASLVDGKGQFLVESYEILTEPSASAFVLFRKRTQQRSQDLMGFALGNISSEGSPSVKAESPFLPDEVRSGLSPLPGTKVELEKINEAFTGANRKSRCLVEQQFKAATVESLVKDAGFIHFATHGVVTSSGNGRYSGLLAPDGYIYVADIFNWTLSSDMVVLSACSTALGQRSEGDDVVSLSRAFMQAGTDNLVATLWSVQDEATRDLMIEFYKNILAGQSKAEALKNAQIKIMKSYPHPCYWSPFVLSGKG